MIPNPTARADLLVAAVVAVPGIDGDYNGDGGVNHADYSVLGDHYGTSFALLNEVAGVTAGVVTVEDFYEYRARYSGEISGVEVGILPINVTPTPTADGNVQWTFSFSNVNGAVAGQFAIRVSGSNNLTAPNILSMTAGPFMTDDGVNPVGLPGDVIFGWEALSDLDPGANVNFRATGLQFNNSTHEAYASLGTTLGQSFSNSTLTFLTLVTQGQDMTTVQLLDEQFPAKSDYGYMGKHYRISGILGATFNAIPEASTILIWSCLSAIAVGSGILSAKQKRGRAVSSPLRD
jgi:hypothetical protein